MSIPQSAVDAYRRDGFVRIRGIISPQEAEAFRLAAERVLEGELFPRLS